MADITDDLSDDGRDKSSYEVGYGKPPKAHQFKPNQSGNPKGRRKGTRNLESHVHEELGARVTINKDGKRRTMTKVQLIAMQLVNNAVKGHLKSIEYLVRLFDIMNPSRDADQSGKPLTEEQRHMLMTLFPLPEAKPVKNWSGDGDANSE